VQQKQVDRETESPTNSIRLPGCRPLLRRLSGNIQVRLSWP